VKLDAEGRPVMSFGAGLILWPHGMDVDRQGNVWVVDARSANAAELTANPNAAGKGHTVLKFSPQGELLLTLGTPGEAGDPPTHFTEPNDVLVAPDGSIYVAETHGAQFQDEPGPNSKSRISKFAPDGTFIKSFGEWGFEDGQLRSPHSLAMDSQGRLFVADRGNRRIQVLDTEGNYIREFTIDVPVDTSRGKVVYGNENPTGTRGSQAPGAPDALCMTPGPNPVLFVGDLYPSRIYKVSLQGEILGVYGQPGRGLGEFGWIHAIACPSEDEIWVGELVNWRLQKLVTKGTGDL
jgi:sugar lactone lactonase YvrE